MIDFGVYERMRARLRRAVTQNNHPGLIAYCATRGILPETLNAWRVSSAGPKNLRWPIYAAEPTGWTMVNARIRQVIDPSADKARDWFEVKGGPTHLAIGNHLLGLDTVKPGKHPSWYADWIDPISEEGGTSESTLGRIKRVLVVEGQWDAMTAWQLGIPNVLSVPSGASNIDVGGLLRYIPERAEVWIGVDMDEAGDAAAERFYTQLGEVKRLIMPVKDLNEWLTKKPDLTAEEVLGTVSGEIVPEEEPKVKVRKLSVAKTVNLGTSTIILDTPWDGLTRRLDGGFRKGATTGILAPSGSGKTTVANTIIAHAVSKEIRVAVVQLEESVESIQQSLVRAALGWSINGEPELQDALLARICLSELNGKVDPEETIDFFEAMAKGGCKLLVMDNWDFSTSGMSNGLMAKSKAYGKFIEIQKRYDTHGIVIWQPGKIDRTKKVNSGDQKGYSAAFQDADNYFTLNIEGLIRRLDVEKARGVAEKEGISSTIWLRYDGDRNVLTQIENPGGLGLAKGPPPGNKDF